MDLLENQFRGEALGSLFHEPAFFRLHEQAPGLFFEGWSDAGCRFAIHFTPHADGLWRSPARGTYAGYAVAADLPLDEWVDAHRRIEQRLVERGAQAVEILTAPMAHDPVAFANQSWLLASQGFQVARCDLGYSLAVDERPLEQRMSRGNAKRLRKCARDGLLAMQTGSETLAAVYEVLAANRNARGYALSMQLHEVQRMQATFPDRLLCFACTDGPRMAAGAVCLRVSPRVLYVQYWGERPGYETHSPVVAVADAIYAYCQSAGIAVLDVGAATIGAEPNPGLIRFKQNLGFEASLKLSFAKRLPTTDNAPEENRAP